MQQLLFHSGVLRSLLLLKQGPAAVDGELKQLLFDGGLLRQLG